jgi:nucleoside-diphosphate-sugar epimerase
MKVMVTGGLGFIGHHVIQELVAQSMDVTILDSKTNYGVIPPAELETLIKLRHQTIPDFPLYITEIQSRSTVDYVVGKCQPEIIIHLASFPRQKTVEAHPDVAARTMIEGLINMLEAARSHKVRRFVFVSSSMVYGDFDDHCSETQECRPRGQYGIMKLAGEMLVRDYARKSGMEYTIIRPSAVYGPRDTEDRVLAKFMAIAHRGGTLAINGRDEALDFTYVTDAAAGIASAALSENTVNRTYNVTRGGSVTLLRAAKIITDLVGRGSIEVRPRDDSYPSRGSLNIDAARRDFGYDPKINIQQGIENYYHWLDHTFYRSKKTV